MHAIILAGGRGERLSTLTDNIPKPMVQVAGRPILEHQIEQLKRGGIDKMVICESYKAGAIQSHFGDGRNFGVDIQHLVLDFDLGSAGAVKAGLKKIPEDEKEIAVVYGDILSDLDFEKMADHHRKTGALVTDLGIEYKLPYGVLRNTLQNSVQEKPIILINGGIYIINRELYSSIPDSGDFSQKVVEGLMGFYVSHYEHHGYWFNITYESDLKEAEGAILRLSEGNNRGKER